jgi:hypothetical protein
MDDSDIYLNNKHQKNSWISVGTMVRETGHIVTVHVFTIFCLLTETIYGAVSPYNDRNVF